MLALSELVTEIFEVIVQETLFLDEVDEHQPVEHYRYVPPLHLLIRNPFKKLQERSVLFLEVVVESFRHTFYIEGCLCPSGDGN